MVNCISYENYLKEKMKRCFSFVYFIVDIFLVLEFGGYVLFRDRWGCCKIDARV